MTSAQGSETALQSSVIPPLGATCVKIAAALRRMIAGLKTEVAVTRDPELRALLEQMQANGLPDYASITVDTMRQTFRDMMKALDNREVAVGKVEDRSIAGAAGDIRTRIYTPVAAGSDPLPALVYFHGGGWVIGDLDTHDTLCRGLTAESGCRVVSVGYRLAPEHPFPAAIEDAYAALKWVESNATAVAIDANRIAVGGDSAGGNLAAVVCQLARAKGRPAVQFQLLIYPCTHSSPDTESRRLFADVPVLNKDSIEWFQRHYFAGQPAPADPRASPLLAENLGGLPRAYIVTAGLDPLRDEARQYAERLRAAGVPVDYVCYDEMVHAFCSMSGVLETAREAIAKAGQALKAALS